jgi:hypothetical protein
MRQNKAITCFLALAAVVSSCLEPFDPQIEDTDKGLYVVSGQVTDQEGYQSLSVSVSSGINAPEFKPITGCVAEIMDDIGNIYPMQDTGEGGYRVWMTQDQLVHGRSYRVRISTPDGREIYSDYEVMPVCPPVDSIYYEIETELTEDPNNPDYGIRFFADVDAINYDSYFFRWEIEETWEYHMDYYKQYYYDGTEHKIDPPDRSTQVCWYTGMRSDIFVVSTLDLSENVYRHYPLHFVRNTTTQLSYLYSILVRQSAISEQAYLYWDKLRVNSQNQGGLYEEQPLPVEGNLSIPANPDARVLGFFGAASVQTRRLFVSKVEGLEINPEPLCIGPVPLGILGWTQFSPQEFPVYFVRIDGVTCSLDNYCVDCLLHGGINVKPDYWPQ